MADQRSERPPKRPFLNREVYARFLDSNYPEALRLVGIVLEEDPDDVMALAIREECLIALGADPSEPPTEKRGYIEEARTAVRAAAKTVVDAEPDTAIDIDIVVDVDEPSSPTLSLSDRNEATRELYRLFLSSEYAPALALAEELLERHPGDPVLGSIADECRAVVDARRSVPVLTSAHEQVRIPLDPRQAFVLARIDGAATVEQLARMANAPVEDVMSHIERFAALGVVTLRPPP